MNVIMFDDIQIIMMMVWYSNYRSFIRAPIVLLSIILKNRNIIRRKFAGIQIKVL